MLGEEKEGASAGLAEVHLGGLREVHVAVRLRPREPAERTINTSNDKPRRSTGGKNNAPGHHHRIPPRRVPDRLHCREHIVLHVRSRAVKHKVHPVVRPAHFERPHPEGVHRLWLVYRLRQRRHERVHHRHVRPVARTPTPAGIGARTAHPVPALRTAVVLRGRAHP